MRYQVIHCALCGKDNYQVLYLEKLKNANLDDRRLFSAKRIPLKLHFRIVKCKECGLVYSTPIYAEDKIIKLYKTCEFIDNDITQRQFLNVMNDYSNHLKKANIYVQGKERLLDIGCGNGQFLKIAKEDGFKYVYGVEPGIDAVRKADPSIRPYLVNDVFHDGLFDKDYFDVVCSFHTLDHIVNPNKFLTDTHKILKASGIMLLVTHNAKSLLTRIAGGSAPMFHIEHIYLFDKFTIKEILNKNGFDVLCNKNLVCTFNLDHIIKTIPLPLFLKNGILSSLKSKRIAGFKIKLMPGDMLTIAGKSNKTTDKRT